MSPRSVLALEAVYQHRLLRTDQVHALVAPASSTRKTQQRLADLRDSGLVSSVRRGSGAQRAAHVWFVTTRGAQLVEAIPNRAEERRTLLTPQQAAGSLQSHTLAVNDVGVAFCRAARGRGDDECGPLAWRHEIAHPLAPKRRENLIADALLRYTLGEGSRVWFHSRLIELHRATMPTDQLADKLARYERLYRYRPPKTTRELWRQRYPSFPGVLVVFDGAPAPALRRRLHLVAAMWDADPRLSDSRIRLYLCLLSDLLDRGPFAPIFTTPKSDEPVDWTGEAGS